MVACQARDLFVDGDWIPSSKDTKKQWKITIFMGKSWQIMGNHKKQWKNNGTSMEKHHLKMGKSTMNGSITGGYILVVFDSAPVAANDGKTW